MNPQPAFDPGLTQQFTGNLRRAINKDGSFNVHRRGGKWNSTTLYLTLIQLSWVKYYALIFGAYLVANLIFAAIYLALGPSALAARAPHDGMEAFLTAFFFSAQTITTVGYGQVAPLTVTASAIASVEAMVGLLGFAVATGLMYGRISRPSARLLFSPSLLVAPFGNGLSLQFRLANARSNQLMDIEATVLLMTVENEKGELKRRYTELSLERNKVNFIPLTWTVVHPITEQSPLWRKTSEDLVNRQAEFLILVRAYDETFSQTVHARSSYRHEEIIWGAKFQSAFTLDPAGDMYLDLGKINDYQPVTLPGLNLL